MRDGFWFELLWLLLRLCDYILIYIYIYKGLRVWILFLLKEQFWKVMVQYPIFNELYLMNINISIYFAYLFNTPDI